MTDYELIDLLGCAFAYGEEDNLAAYLAPDCEYESEYAHSKVKTAGKIIERMKQVNSCVTDDCRYSYSIILLNDVLRDGKQNEMCPHAGVRINEYGLLLYQYSDEFPVAVVIAELNDNDLIKRILLSRSTSLFDVSFYMEECGKDSPDDLPLTVRQLTPHDRQVRELRRSFSGQHLDESPEMISGDVFVWKKADEFVQTWLEQQAYKVLESKIFDDCIGYRCNRRNHAYTIYMYAYGRKKTARLDGDNCKKLLEHDLSKNSTVLVVYLKVKRLRSGNKETFKVCHHSGDESAAPELWHVKAVDGKWILQYYPRKELIDATSRLMYAFNRDDLDAYDCVVCENDPAFHELEYPGYFYNPAFYSSLRKLHQKYGEMKYGYVRYNDAVYSLTPYLDGYGFFGFRVDNNTNLIISVTAHPFEGDDREVAEYIKTDEREKGDWYKEYPKLVGVKALPPVATERFALKLSFDNGEIRKYVLPISADDEKDDVVSYNRHVFTDNIWRSASVVNSRKAEIEGFIQRGPAVKFKNGYYITGMFCYQESEAYSEPVLCNETIYQDDAQTLERVWIWDANALWEDKETGYLQVLLSGFAFNYNGTSTFASFEGKRLCSLNLDYSDHFKEGLARVGKHGHGYGFIDREMRFAFPMIYENAEDFNEGKAKVMRGGRWLCINQNGHEINLVPSEIDSKYQDVGFYSEGMCKVSTLKLDLVDLAYHSDYAEIAGTWGFVNEAGEEVIAPQFIYAEDFYNGLAFVCKGKWTIDPKWDNEYNTGRYWTEEELWGAIDKSGNTVIPFIFDEIKHFEDTEDVFMAHFGGWETGHWGVIDNHGNWLAEPIFASIDYEYHDGLFAFYRDDRWEDDNPLGIYDLKQKKVLFEPQFFDVSFLNDGWIEVEVFDESLGRKVEKLIDRNGKEKFHSVYSSIYTWKKPYEVIIQDEEGNRHGLIDENGNVILPCKYDVPFNGISYDQQRMIIQEDNKCGIMDFDGNTVVPAIYHEIHGMSNPLITVRVGEKNNYTEGLIKPDGTVVIPAEYSRISWCRDNYIVCCREGHCELLRYESKKDKGE